MGVHDHEAPPPLTLDAGPPTVGGVSGDLATVIRPQTVCLDLKARDKEEVIARLVDLLADAGEIADRRAVLDAVLERERKMSTGMQHGIAIPHGKTDTLERIVAAVGIHRKGVEFQSLDGKPARIVIVTVSPQGASGPHVRFLAEVSRLLTNARTRAALLKAKTPEDVVRALGTAG